MAPGDLNLKKSWFPGLKKNQAKVWEMEQAALQEHKRIQERQAEFEKEKQKKELIDLQIKNNPHLKNKLISDRIDWLYDDPNKNNDPFLDDKEKDDYLLGKKKLSNMVVSKNDSKMIDKHDRLSNALSLGSSKLPNEKDLMKKSKDDPMAKIQQEQIRKLQILKRERHLKDQQSRDSSRIRRPDSSRHHRSSSSHRHHGSHSHRSYRDGDRHSTIDEEPRRYERDHRDERDRRDVRSSDRGYRERDSGYKR